MKKTKMLIAGVGLFLSFCMVLTGCSGKGVGGSNGNGSNGTTVVSGKVSLSGALSTKASMLKTMFSVPTGKPGTKAYREQAATISATALSMVLNASLYATSLSGAKVEMYNADHPEWLFPVASGSTQQDGTYTLSSMTNASSNEGATYQDGDPIPAGKYTLLATKFKAGQKPLVAVQTLVKILPATYRM